MTAFNLALILSSTFLSALGQIALKVGTSTPHIKAAMADADLIERYRLMLSSPLVIGGLLSYVLGTLVWLRVISALDISQAYPFVALGFLVTLAFGLIVLGEPMHPTRLIGAALILGGVVLVGLR